MWPQIIVIVLIMLNVGLALGKNGEPRSNYSFWSTVFDASLFFILLYWGGFFKVMFKG
jgi:hypothetical protein